MRVVNLPMLAILGIALWAGSAQAQDDGQAAAQVDSRQPDAAPVLGLLESDADQEAIEFGKELRTVEEDVGDLKERVFRSKATLQLLKELVIDGAVTGSRVVLWHVNELGGGYSMESIQYFLDGKNVFAKVDAEGGLDDTREFKIHEQTVPPGKHNVQIMMELRGKGYRIFSYLRSYQFRVQSSYTFEVEEGSMSVVRIVSESKGGFKSFNERPTVRYDARTENIREE